MSRWLLVLLAALVGCDGPPPSEALPEGPRIASLSPAMTRMLLDLDLGDLLVGRTGYCRNVDDVPVVGDLHTLNAEALVRVGPTIVLVQRPVDAQDAMLEHLTTTHDWVLVQQPLADLHDVRTFIERLPGVLPEQPHLPQACRTTTARMDRAMQRRTPVAKRVLLVSPGTEPLAWGAQTYLGQLLEAAGGNNLVEGCVWRSMSLEEIVRLQPDLVLTTDTWPEPPGGLPVAAIGIEGLEYPGPHLAEAVEQLALLLAND